MIAKLWRGEISLVKTYWIYGVLLTILIGIIQQGIYLAFPALLATPTRLLIFTIISPSFMWSAFMMIAIWRSAGKYNGKKIWQILARCAVIIGVVSIIIGIAHNVAFIDNLSQFK